MKASEYLKLFQFFKKEGIETEKIKFGEINSADGKWVITYQGDMIEIGMPVFVMDGANQIPAPDGEIALEDGRTIVISGGEGMVAEIKEATPEPNPNPEPTPNPEPAPAEEQMSKEEITRTVQETVRKFYEDKAVEDNKVIETFKSENDKLREAVMGLVTIVEKISEEPAVAPAKEVKPVKGEQKFSYQEQLDRITKLTLKK